MPDISSHVFHHKTCLVLTCFHSELLSSCDLTSFTQHSQNTCQYHTQVKENNDSKVTLLTNLSAFYIITCELSYYNQYYTWAFTNIHMQSKMWIVIKNIEKLLTALQWWRVGLISEVSLLHTEKFYVKQSTWQLWIGKIHITIFFAHSENFILVKILYLQNLKTVTGHNIPAPTVWYQLQINPISMEILLYMQKKSASDL